MWILVGATSCHVVFNGGHILPRGFEWGPHLGNGSPPTSATSLLQHVAMWFLVGATSGNVIFSGGHILECGF